MDKEFVIFESIRKKKGGGTLIAAHEDFDPKLIEEYSDDFELLVVEINTQERSIRVITGYGPQENWEEGKRLPFFMALETEIERAELAGKSVIVEMDARPSCHYTKWVVTRWNCRKTQSQCWQWKQSVQWHYYKEKSDKISY